MGLLSRVVDRAVNRTALPGRLPASDDAIDLVRRSPVVDLVVGTALFRDLDAAQWRAASLNVVGLTIATAWPDLGGSLSRWHFRSLGIPASAIGSSMAIAGWLIGRVERWCAESAGELVIVRSGDDLGACMEPGGPVGILLGVQGGHVLGGDPANIARLREAGVLMFAPAHVMDNGLVGSGTGRSSGGLTGLGREAIAELEAQSIIVDLAHMSVAGIEQALPLLRRPFVLSHTGLTDVSGGRSRWRRYSPATRNIPASLAAQVGAAGGLIGIVLSTELLGGSSLDAAVRTIRLAVECASEEQVAIGSDMDGALKMLIDVEGLPALVDALLAAGMTAESIRRVLGQNAAEFLGGYLTTTA